MNTEHRNPKAKVLCADGRTAAQRRPTGYITQALIDRCGSREAALAELNRPYAKGLRG